MVWAHAARLRADRVVVCHVVLDDEEEEEEGDAALGFHVEPID